MIFLWILAELAFMYAVYFWGFENGEHKGREAEFWWWFQTESEVDQARQEIWREEGSRQ